MHNTSDANGTKVLNLPSGYFGMVLGIIGMGLAWRYAATVWPVPAAIGHAVVGLACAIWSLLAGAFLWRFWRYRDSVMAEVRHPLLSSYVSLFPATMQLVAIGVQPVSRPLALGLFSCGAAMQLFYAGWQSAGLWRGGHPAEATTPGLYLPTVANNFIGAMACGALGFHDLGWLFLGAGLLSWLSLEPAVLMRLRNHGEMALPQRASLGIQVAPALVACSAYLAVNGGQADSVAKMLFGYGLLQLFFVARLYPWFSGQPFSPAFWSFSFGLSALATTGLHLGHSGNGILHVLALPLFILANLVIGFLFCKTLGLLVRGKLLVYVPRPDTTKR